MGNNQYFENTDEGNITGHMVKKYGKQLNSERVIAINGERGRQSELLQEGLNIIPFVRVIYDISMEPYVIIPEGKCGLLTAIDGSPLGKDLFTAPDWVTKDLNHKRDSIEQSMIDPKTFIENNGKKGPQLNILKPGEYKINTFMWDIAIVPSTAITEN